MIRFRHKGCQSEVFRYVGQRELTEYTVIRSAEWQLPDCTHPNPSAPVYCPDCGQSVHPTARCLEPIPETEAAET